MWYSPGGAIAAAIAAMTAGGFLGFVIRSAVLFLVAYFVLAASIGRPRSQLASAAAAIAAAASGGYHVVLLLFGLVGFGGIGVLIGLLAAWLAIHVTSEKILALDLEKSGTLTGTIACTSFLVWLILGLLLVLRRTGSA